MCIRQNYILDQNIATSGSKRIWSWIWVSSVCVVLLFVISDPGLLPWSNCWIFMDFFLIRNDEMDPPTNARPITAVICFKLFSRCLLRVPKLWSFRPGFDSLAESNQKTLKVGIYSFSSWRSAFKRVSVKISRQVRLLCPWARHLWDCPTFEWLDW